MMKIPFRIENDLNFSIFRGSCGYVGFLCRVRLWKNIFTLLFGLCHLSSSTAQAQSKNKGFWPTFRYDRALTAHGEVAVDTSFLSIDSFPITSGDAMSPVIAQDGTIIIILKDEKTIYAFWPNGEPRWLDGHITNIGEPLSAPAVISKDGTIYVGSTMGGLYTVSLRDRSLRRIPIPSDGSSSPAVIKSSVNLQDDGTVLVAAERPARLFAVKNEQSRLIHSTGNNSPASSPAIDANGNVFVAFGNTIYGFDSNKDFAQLGTWRDTANVKNFTWVAASPNKSVIHIWGGSNDRRSISVFQPVKGSSETAEFIHLFSQEPAMPALSSIDSMFVVLRNDEVIAHHARQNRPPFWRKRLSVNGLPIVDANKLLWITGKENSANVLYALSLNNGDIIKKYPLAGETNQSLAIGPNGVIWAATDNGKVSFVGPEPRIPRSLAAFSQQQPEVCRGGTIEISVILRDQFGDSLQGHFIDFSVEDGGGTISDTTVCTDEKGVARTRWTLGALSDSQRVKAVGYAPASVKMQPVIFTAKIAEPRLPEIHEVVFSPPVNSGGMRDTTITITNAGPCTLKIDSLAIFDDPGNRFCILQNEICQNRIRPLIELPKDSSLVVDLQFKAGAFDSMEQTATLRIYSNDSNSSRSNIPLKGLVEGPPRIRVETDSLSFTEVCLDSMRMLPLVIQNVGGDALTIKEFVFSDPAYTASHVRAPISPGHSDTVTITFKPTEKKSYLDTLTINSNASNNPMLEVPLSGEGITAEIPEAAEPVFDSTKICMRTTASYVITNDSACDLVLESINVDRSDFRLLLSATRDTIPPDSTFEIVLEFAPSGSGWRMSNLRLKDKYDEKVVSLKGFGIPTPKIEVTHGENISFFETCASDTASNTSTKIYNRGNAPLIVNLSTSDDAIFRLPIKSLSIPPDSSRQIEVRFIPSRAGSFTDTLRIIHDDPCRQAFSIPLSGEGIAPTVEITSLMGFDSTEIGQADTATWRITNTAQECDVLIKNTVIDGKNAGDFHVVEGNWRERISPNDSREFMVKFKPLDGLLGWRVATLYLNSNASSDSIPLKGYANADTTPPGHLTSLSVDPPGWSNINSFRLILGLPNDPSGIAKVYYKIGSPPTPADCLMADSVDCKTASCETVTIAAPGLGKHEVYIWLEDGKGNSNCMNGGQAVIYGQIAIYFDDEFSNITHTKSGVVELNEPIEVTATASDAVSGIAEFKLYYRLGGGPRFSNPTEGFEVQSFKNGKATIPGSFVTNRGVEYKIAAVDLAGNQTFHPSDSNSFHAVQVNLPEAHYKWLHAGGTHVENYRLLSFPMEQNEPSVARVLDDDIFLHNKNGRPAKWSARLWDIAPQKTDSLRPFIEFPEVGDFNAGHAMFLFTKHDEIITSEAGITVITNEPFKIPGTKGWNLISIPFNFNIPVENLLLGSPGIHGNNVFTFAGKWVRVDTLRPWQGYLIKIAEGAPSDLSIQPSEAILPNTPGFEIGESTPQLEWSIAIRTSCEQIHDLDNVIGVVADADTAWDRFERLEMPPVGDFIALYFRQEQWQSDRGYYTTDYRPSLQEGQSWKFEVTSNIKGRSAKLSFENLSSVPSQHQLVLIDEGPGIVQDLRSDSLYWFRTSEHETPRLFRLLVGPPDYVNEELAQYAPMPTDFVLEQNFPNPFNAVTMIKFGLPKTAKISLLVYNAKGELVRTLIADEERTQGYYAKLWEGVDQNGRSVASGIYFCQLREGKNKIVATKKLILIK